MVNRAVAGLNRVLSVVQVVALTYLVLAPLRGVVLRGAIAEGHAEVTFSVAIICAAVALVLLPGAIRAVREEWRHT